MLAQQDFLGAPHSGFSEKRMEKTAPKRESLRARLVTACRKWLMAKRLRAKSCWRKRASVGAFLENGLLREFPLFPRFLDKTTLLD
jgi:hypothetical protein